jgi:hypothetical protein
LLVFFLFEFLSNTLRYYSVAEKGERANDFMKEGEVTITVKNGSTTFYVPIF